MRMEERERLARFEQMQAAVEENYQKTLAKMAALRAAGKTKTATYYQLMSEKMQAKQLLTLYAVYGLREGLPEE